jgi:hypothetical protein
MRDFIGEDDIETFEGWLRYQAVDLTTATADEREFWRTALKTFNDKKMGPPQKRQPLTSTFPGTEPLGAYGGHAPKSVGAICDPAAFSGVVEVPPGVVGPRHGMVVVDLIEPGCEPMSWPFVHVVRQEIFRDFLPWIVIRIGS